VLLSLKKTKLFHILQLASRMSLTKRHTHLHYNRRI